MAKKQFKAESKRLLDLMINSIYTHKEIFLREIISNASDACDKLCYQALTDDSVKLTRKDFKIDLSVDKEGRTITVTDNGIGMDEGGSGEQSGRHRLLRLPTSSSRRWEQDDQGATDVIGQFGVGFYSAFMVARPRSPSPPGPTARTRRGSGSPPARTATPSPSARRRRRAPISSCTSSRRRPRTTTTIEYLESYRTAKSWSKNTPTISATPSCMARARLPSEGEASPMPARTTSPSGRL